MSAKKHHHTFAVMLLLGVALLFVLIIFSYYNPNSPLNTASNTSEQITVRGDVYKSDFLNISLAIPQKFKIEENSTLIIARNNEGEIRISRRSTNYNNLNNYYESLMEKNNLSELSRETLKVSSLEAIKSEVSGPGYSDKAYYFYPTKWTVYSISTTSPSLYDELDQVAQSFRYLGETSDN